ncbi:uncharacterized protein [Cicer arietinum]|uniref:Uncharacterized protein DDB_G0290301-like n=1 Tax=Cicer arietinum TaxID=3827 RepID=A0A1S2XUD8_CICAR|nr:uncharacterized protein DDB_G0290301-like [Cicer arietinum]
METNGPSSGIFPTINNGFLGLENPLKQQQQQQQNLQNQHTLHHHQMVSYTNHHDNDQPIKQNYPYSSKTNKPQQITLSDEDEPCFGAEETTSSDPKRKGSPWHRMKWTDSMVRLLIMAVYYIGDEAGGSEGIIINDKKKSTTGLLQKKGKWKSVSKGMMEKGYYVSPQQCEDKFNDLNKRFKRVNDILGKGTACRVVENQSLLDTMDLTPKMKEEARKLLNSKHLFFREMCAYHNSCGHGSNNLQQQSSIEAQPQPQQHHQQQQKCLHSSNGMLKLKRRSGEEEEEEDEDDEWEEENDSEEEEEEEDELSFEGGSGSKGHHDQEDENNNNIDHIRKKTRKVSSHLMQQLSSEVMNVLQDGVKSNWEKKQWMKKREVQLAEQQINYHVEAFEIEKQRLKWAKFSGNKEREIERHKLENEGKRLEIDRMVLVLRQKEIELQNTQQQQQQHSST